MASLTFLSHDDVLALDLTIGDVIPIVERALCEHAWQRTVMPPKTEVASESSWFMHAMPAIVPAMSAAGMKWVSYHPRNRERGLPNSSAILVLNDTESGLPYCIIDAMWPTYARTAACAILTMRHLGPNELRVIALVGAGDMARALAPHFDAALDELREIRVITRSRRTAVAYCDEIAPRVRARVHAVNTIDAAVAGADVVISSIGATAIPPLGHEHLRPGSLALTLDAEHAWESVAFSSADKVYADDGSVFLDGFRRRRPGAEPPALTGEISDVVAGLLPGRERDSERIMASNNGIAILDVALGRELHRRALALGLGQELQLMQPGSRREVSEE